MDATPPPGLLGSARAVLAVVLEIGQTRLQLASTELEEERLRLTGLLLYAVVALFFVGIGVVLASLLLVLLFWDGPRVLVLAIETAVFLGTGLALVVVLRQKAKRKPPLLATTIDELRRDREALQRGLPGGLMVDSDRRLVLASRRALLVQRAAAQRRQLAQAVVPLAQSWRWLERGMLVWREVRRRPWLVAVPAGLLLAWRPRAVLRAVAALPLLWRVGRTAFQLQRQWSR